jgi:hypothetical protein
MQHTTAPHPPAITLPSPEEAAAAGAPWATLESELLAEVARCGSNITHVDESELCHKFDSVVIDERKSTSDRIKEVIFV